jgi:KDO2-lipid IV(A) lauroyltransferase
VSSARAPLWERAAGRLLDVAARALERLPARLAYALADCAALPLLVWGLGHELRVARAGRGARRNLRIAYRGSLRASEAFWLLARHGRHLAHLAVDLCRLPRIDAGRLERCVDLAALETVRALLAEGRGLVCVSGHLGVWELLPHAASLAGLPVTVVVRRRAHPALDGLLARLRASGGQRCVPQRRALRALRSALARGEIAGLLADEDERDGPIFAPFLGALAATSPAAALLQSLSGAPIAVVGCERTARGRYAIRLWRVIRPPAGAARRAEAMRVVTAEISAALGQAILARPEQWLWGSRRFATRPPGETPGPEGLPPPVPRATDLGRMAAHPARESP